VLETLYEKVVGANCPRELAANPTKAQVTNTFLIEVHRIGFSEANH
jgi:hypothetical protein